jgi:hypothetical protein
MPNDTVDVFIHNDLSTTPEPVPLGPKHNNKSQINWINQAAFDVTVTIDRETTGAPGDPKSPFPNEAFAVHPGVPKPSGKIKDHPRKHQEYAYSVRAGNGSNDPRIIIDR